QEAGAQGGRGNEKSPSPEATGFSPYAQALADHGMSRQSAHRFQALANVPEEDFEAALKAPEKPTTAGVLGRAALKNPPPQPRVSDEALWIWGRLRDLER